MTTGGGDQNSGDWERMGGAEDSSAEGLHEIVTNIAFLYSNND